MNATQAVAAVTPPKWSAPTLYRKLLKLYINKFDTDHNMIIRAVRQTKQEFYFHRQHLIDVIRATQQGFIQKYYQEKFPGKYEVGAMIPMDTEEVHGIWDHAVDIDQVRKVLSEEENLLLKRGEQVFNSLQGGIIPIYSNPKTGEVYCKYDKATLDACGGHIDPVTAEEFVRKYQDKLPKEELMEIQQKLVNAGRWSGKLEFDNKDTLSYKMKTQRKPKKSCSDPDEPEKATEGSATAPNSTNKEDQ